MAKRLSSGQSNTILNYFQSPKAKIAKEVKEDDVKKEKALDEESPVQQKKRKINSIVDSDSDDGIKPTPKKQKDTKKADSSDEEQEKKKRTNGFNTPGKRKGDGIKPTPKKQRNAKKADSSDEQKEKTHTNGFNTPGKRKGDDLKKVTATPSKDKGASISGDIHGSWLHNRLPFLQLDQIRDANKNRPDDPNYDPRTLYVPPDFLDKQTPAMRQWWILKGQHMDTVLFFKVGKFYELYHMDAVVGVTQLGFSYMKGEFAHSGFPESAYYKMANALIEKGFKVARTEQTETPEMMAERCKKQTKTTKYDKVVKREICQISTKASCVYSAQLPDAMHSQLCHMFAISEKDISGKDFRFGVCFVDTSIGTIHLAEFDDDKHCSQLLSLLAEYTAGLILTAKKKSAKLQEILNAYCKDIRKEALAPDSQFYSASTTIEKLMNANYFRSKDGKVQLPELFSSITEGCNPKPGYELALKSFGGCLWYLEDSKLDIQVVSMGKFQLYQPLNMISKATSNRKFMVLDSVTIGNLNLLGGIGTLQRTLDHCKTAFGSRLVQQWICRPLCDVDKIKERQEAVQELYKTPALLESARSILKKLPDLERQLAKIHTYGNRFFAKDHPDSRAVFYEAKTYSKRRIADLLRTLQGFESAQNVHSVFADCESPLLRRFTQFPPTGTYPDLSASLEFFKEAFDQEEASAKGKINPKRGVDEMYDEAEDAINEINERLQEYLSEQQKFFGCKVTYFGSDKKRFQLDIPESHTRKVTNEYQLEGTKKGAKPSKRYSTAHTRQLLAEMLKAESERAKIIQDLNRRIFEKFSERHSEWEQAINCIANLDALCSLAFYARNYSQEVCIPQLEPFSESRKIVIDNGRHPCVINGDSFVPNDTKMGVEGYPNLLLITGPNMGGKSTLMRQIAIMSVMAQIGSYVPASKCQMNLIDRIFTRLGAHDDIVQGHSTFLVELSEASLILQHATAHSLVLLDELGRGTSTHDGNAIATAYVQKLTHINCRTLFSTHYHSLVDHFIDRSDVQLGHMACKVENDDDSEESVTFLYKVDKGRCPKSYGFNVAKLAGLASSIVSRGREIAQQLEQENRNRQVFKELFVAKNVASIRKMLSVTC